MENATAIRLFVVFLAIAAIAATILQQPLIGVAAFILIIITTIAGFGIITKADAKKLVEKKAKFNKFPDTLLSEGIGGAILYFVISLVLMVFFVGIINLVLQKQPLDNLEMSIVLALMLTVFRYYTYKQYKQLKTKTK
ncbi:MAG: hypothetical protein V1722_01275 [Candidatus Micrarchaeota archaeon]